jgi:hypothetical protein
MRILRVCPVFLVLGGLVIGACAGGEPESTAPILVGRMPVPPISRAPIPPDTTPPTSPADECTAEVENPCMRYRIPLDGNPSADIALRTKYTAAFGSACYMSDANPSTFNCFYRTWKKACADAVFIGEVSGNDVYTKGYTCEPVGNGDYTLQIGDDKANKLTVYFEGAPRQTPLIEVNNVPTAVSGPYRNLPEPQDIGPGVIFSEKQRESILQANRDARIGDAGIGEIHSDLAGFTWPCEENGKPTMCVEKDVLKEGPFTDADAAQVHHVVPKKDPRCCPWGTNSNSNAIVISRKLNTFFTNKDPPLDEVLLVNQIPPYLP